ncbi:hypothetical protein [Nonomuraea turcica]|uniref:hypothetical protein n=1 Tax=Nonomuraea sp. G32 TaxID=3067274 RepID=UPI00273BCB4C|nr:hypothetical protein [Nonomuraea sp. G32]MDP4506180.1 hypothetical protein [Nonomuraea sp. G32]
MADFWVGAIAGILGALVGGFFTAWGARLQVRGVLEAARLEINATVREERRARQVASQHAALIEMFRVVGKCLHILEEETDSHKHHSADTDCDGSPSLELKHARMELECAYWVYNHELYDDEELDGTPIDKLMHFLSILCSKNSELLSNYIPKGFSKEAYARHCDYNLIVGYSGDPIAFDAWEYLRGIRKTLDT